MLVIISSGEAVRVAARSQHFSRPGRAGFCRPGSRYASQGLWRGLVEVHGKAACPIPQSLAPKDYAESVRDLLRAPKQNSHKRGLLPSAEVGPCIAHLTARFVLSRVVQATLTGEKSIPPEPPSDDQAEEAETQLGRAGRHPHRAAVRGARLAPPRSGRERRGDRRYIRDRAGPCLPGCQPCPRTDGRTRRRRNRSLGGRSGRARSVAGESSGRILWWTTSESSTRSDTA
jgi:hypothetical protein